MNNLSDIRKEIDEIDKSIYDLFARRIDLSENVAEYKIANQMNVFDPAREEEKLSDIAIRSDDPFISQGMVELFSQIMSISKKKQYRMLAEAGLIAENDFKCIEGFDFTNARVIYQGVRGAYSMMAAEAFFGEGHPMENVDTWRDAFEALINDKADYAVLPIENSTAGSIDENYDLITEYDVAIIGEQIIEVEHALLGLKGADIGDIRTVFSHPQALMQCEKYFLSHPEIRTVAMENTAVSARKIKEDNDISQAAVAGEINERLYDLRAIDHAIQDQRYNRTRFIIVSKEHIYTAKAANVSLCFELSHTKGALYQALSHIIFNGLNMTRIESRPIKDVPWEYRFYVDFIGNLNEEGTINALRGLSEEMNKLKILGNY